MNIPCYLIPALVGLICGILGYLLGKMLSGSNSDDYNYKSELIFKGAIKWLTKRN